MYYRVYITNGHTGIQERIKSLGIGVAPNRQAVINHAEITDEVLAFKSSYGAQSQVFAWRLRKLEYIQTLNR